MPRPLRALSLAALALLSVSLPAVAQQSGYGEVVCSSSQRQGHVTTCEGHFDITLHSEGVPTIYGIQLTAPAGHCAPVSYGVVRAPFASGADVVGMTRALNAGETEWFELGRDFAAGSHTLQIIANGLVAGCNTGAMQSWGVHWQTMVIPE